MKVKMGRLAKVAVVGASGYSGEELVRLLLVHPGVELTAITSRQYAGKALAEVFPKFSQYAAARSLRFTEPDAAALANVAHASGGIPQPCRPGRQPSAGHGRRARQPRSLPFASAGYRLGLSG